ncbi:MAG: hypothetical protein CMO01_28770 [Thalassobius sp.]|nr:hypothetical protein [Thalassovita sp.]
MRIVLNKIFFLCVFVYLLWLGVSGLIVNFSSWELEEFQMEEIESNGVGFSKYIKIKNSYPTGEYVWLQNEDSETRIDLIYPIVSIEKYEDILYGEKVIVNAFVRLNNVKNSCLLDSTCIPNDIDIKGVIKSGFDSFSYDEMKVFETDNIQLAEDFILIENGTKPRELYINIILFLVGSIFGGAILKSFFKKSSSFKDWIDNVTEKKELT